LGTTSKHHTILRGTYIGSQKDCLYFLLNWLSIGATWGMAGARREGKADGMKELEVKDEERELEAFEMKLLKEPWRGVRAARVDGDQHPKLGWGSGGKC
jgi:hypothetical protein